MVDYIKIRLEEYNELKLKIIKLEKLKKIIYELKRLEALNRRYNSYLSKVRQRFGENRISKSVSLDRLDNFNFSDIYL